ncbi:uncharacterized protein [Porites lutea]|uniref:uncharacterized protein n=1 Tax=Porites lutea TaxID=51062 RepID=UPI003CC5B878
MAFSMESATNGTSNYLTSYAWHKGELGLYGAVQKEFEGERRHQIERFKKIVDNTTPPLEYLFTDYFPCMDNGSVSTMELELKTETGESLAKTQFDKEKVDESILPDIKRLTCLSNKDMARKLSKTITTMTKDKRICGKEITFLVPEVIAEKTPVENSDEEFEPSTPYRTATEHDDPP